MNLTSNWTGLPWSCIRSAASARHGGSSAARRVAVQLEAFEDPPDPGPRHRQVVAAGQIRGDLLGREVVVLPPCSSKSGLFSHEFHGLARIGICRASRPIAMYFWHSSLHARSMVDTFSVRLSQSALTLSPVRRSANDLCLLLADHAVHGPVTSIASLSPGHGGIVTPMAASGSRPVFLNWKDVPTGMVSDTPGLKSISRGVSPP